MPKSNRMEVSGINLMSPLTAGLVALAIPAFYTLSAQTWSHEEGAHGPLVICTAGWLIWRELPTIRKRGVEGKDWVTGLALAVSLILYIFGVAFDFITLAAAGLYGAALAIFYSLFGSAEIIRNWFIFF